MATIAGDKAVATRQPGRELTVRGIILGGLITLVFTAANVYLGLRVGLTFATSIPAAVISMAILRLVPGATILENNIVQTVASAAGTLAAIIFVLPGLVIIGWWQGFPYWTTACVCMTGGVLGVMFSVPLRRALVTGSDLPYPEGVAAAEVLTVGSAGGAGAEDNARGLRVILMASLISAGVALLEAMQLVAAEVTRTFRVGGGATGFSAGLSMSLIGIGHLVGLSVGIAMLVGMLITWAGIVPFMTATHGLHGSVDAAVQASFVADARFIGAGTIGVAAIWTLIKIARPIVMGLTGAMAAQCARGKGAMLDLTERDLPIGWVGALSLLCLVPIGWLLWQFAQGGPVEGQPTVILSTIAFIVIIGVIIAAVCGYMAGLIGASNSPVSGVGILAVICVALMLSLFFGRGLLPDDSAALTAYALFSTAIVFSVATISNDNLQDLKTGQLVGATPWKQQVALVIGVIFGSLVIPPVLDLLNHTMGFAGAPHAGPNALAAPQAGLISALARGVLGGNLQWDMIGWGALLGVAVIVIDELLGRLGRMRLPPLGVGLGIYLPMSATLLVPVGAIIGHFWDCRAATARNPELVRRMGVLLATGLIVGESLFGVLFAGIVGITGRAAPLAVVGDGFAPIADVGGALVFAALVAVAYARTRHLGDGVAAPLADGAAGG